jgi:tetratricopeptide (TPR) repeat protein
MHDSLNTALHYHQQGRLHEAADLYQRILAADPGHAEALHLLGVVAHQVGQHTQAVELIGRAATLSPEVAAYRSNLAEAHRALGDCERAEVCCRDALRLQAHYPEAHNNLGLALLGQGKAADAADCFREALRLRPDFALACNNLGNALRYTGDTAGALDHFRRAVGLDPVLAEAHSNLGQMLLEGGQTDEALAHCREAVRLRPQFAEAQCNLGNVLRERGRLAEAKACYAEALRLSPGVAMTYNNMGQALQEEGQLEEALTWYAQALQRDLNSARIHCNLAGALQEAERRDEAIVHYESALRLDPCYAEAHNGLGWVRHEQGRFDEALTLYREALRLRPGLAAAHCNLGTTLEELSDLEAAQACYREAFRHDQRHVGSVAQLATLLRGKLPEEDLAVLQQLLADPDLPEGRRLALHFGLAHVLDARGAYAEAAEHLRRGNALALAHWRRRGLGYESAAHARFVDGMIGTCTPDLFARAAGFGTGTPRPVFIVGLPRSGTTLLEQILASHPQAFGAGELPLAREGFLALAGPGAAEERGLKALHGLDGETAARLAGRHLERLAALNGSAARVVDKMPDNYLYLGLLALLFPKATFIHCRRDLRDVAVSCWMTHFRHIRWANAPEDIAARFRDYRRLMDHWRRVLPVPVHEIAYEEVVDDLEGSARRLLDWCGLEWDATCLAFHRTKRPVRTASVTQVRQPLYRHALARWRHYEHELAPLFGRLPADPDAGPPPG